MTKYAALDLDRTLLDTEAFTNDVSAAAAQMAGVTKQQFIEDSGLFRYMSSEGLSHYDLFAQLGFYGIKKCTDTEIALAETMRSGGKVYTYDDVGHFLLALKDQDYEPFVLTYGEDTYQRLKVALSPALSGLSIVVVQEPKGLHLATIVDGSGVLFDDTQQNYMPSSWQYVQVDRVHHPKDALLMHMPLSL